jgi:hypothetical protein
VQDILSQGGGRKPRPWRPWAAAAVVALVAAGVIVQHLAHHRQPGRAADTATPAGSGAAAVVAGQPKGPNGIVGHTLPWDARLAVPAAGEQPAWFWPATGRMTPVGGLPPERTGYEFTRVTGGWAVQPNSGVQPGCSSCTGPLRSVYFLADGTGSVTRVGMAAAVAPGATAGALWLTRYPPGADTRTAAGTAQEVSVGGAPLGPPRRLPAGFVIDQATERGLLLAPVVPRSGFSAYELWDPAGRQPSRSFAGVIAASARKIAWAAPCARQCRVHVLNLASARPTVIRLPAGNSVANAAFSPDGRFLALQVSFASNGDDGALDMQLDVASVATGRVMNVPRVSVSSDALVSFGWPAGRDILVAALSFTARVQLAAWRPGAGRLAVADVRPGQSPVALVIGPSAR